MRHLFFVTFCCFCCFILISCASTQRYADVQANPALIKETWIKEINTNASRWVARENRWFLTGEPRYVEDYATNAPYSNAMTSMKVYAPCFTEIDVDGPFEIQITGRQVQNSIVIVGPNALLRQTVVDVSRNKIAIHLVKDSKLSPKGVIIRIGMGQLHQLTTRNGAMVYGRNITSHDLTILSAVSAESADTAVPCGHIAFVGTMRVRYISHSDPGTMTLIGVETPALTIRQIGNGNLNISGRVGVQSITHIGSGELNIIGMDSNALSVTTGGSGKTGLLGLTKLRQITAKDNSRVYLYPVNTAKLNVALSDQSRVGLAGAVNQLNVYAIDASCFDGQSLCAVDAYVQTRNNAHANISANNKLFATAANNSSIYYFGPDNRVSRYTSGNGLVLPIWRNTIPTPPVAVADRFIAYPSNS